MAENGSNAIHNITPVEITINGSKAFSISVGNILMRFTKNGTEYELVSKCRFLSRVERLAGQASQIWKMLSMEVIYINDAISQVIPDTMSGGFSFEEAGAFPRRSYRLLAYCLSEKGYPIKQDLPGVDDEKLVADVLDRNLSWVKT